MQIRRNQQAAFRPQALKASDVYGRPIPTR